MAYTPGPWFVFGNGHCVGGPHHGNETAGVAMCAMRLRDEEENAANARLIAAAPDLLAALRAVLDRHNYQGTGEPWPHLLVVVRAAINRAEGGDA